MRRQISFCAAAVLLVLSTLPAGCTSNEERTEAEAVVWALCGEGVSSAAPDVYAHCHEVRRQLSLPWNFGLQDAITQLSSEAARACAPMTILQDTPLCRKMERHVEQLSPVAVIRAFPPLFELTVSEAAQLFENVCGREQSGVNADSMRECGEASRALQQARQQGSAIEAAQILRGALFSSSIGVAAATVADTCWPRGADEPRSDGGCGAVHWTWRQATAQDDALYLQGQRLYDQGNRTGAQIIVNQLRARGYVPGHGDEHARCEPDLGVLQTRNLSELARVEAKLHYMRQPSMCIS